MRLLGGNLALLGGKITGPELLYTVNKRLSRIESITFGVKALGTNRDEVKKPGEVRKMWQ